MSGGYAWRDRNPSPDEVERLRLILSAFKDGSGNVRAPDGRTRADWRQVERAVAECFGGEATEAKGIFDVLIEPEDGKPFGLSVKTSQRRKDGRVLMELANPAAQLKAAAEVDQVDWETDPEGSGGSLLRTITSWHDAQRPTVDVERSSYVVLTHDREKTRYQLFRFPLRLPDPDALSWSQRESRGRTIVGKEDDETLIEFYPWSGGQVKFFPQGDSAIWRSSSFELETPPATSLTRRAAEYWPEKWQRAGGA